jgi:hypothetical protein
MGERQQLVIGNVLFSRTHTIRYMYRPSTDNAWNISIPLNGITDLSTVGECQLTLAARGQPASSAMRCPHSLVCWAHKHDQAARSLLCQACTFVPDSKHCQQEQYSHPGHMCSSGAVRVPCMCAERAPLPAGLQLRLVRSTEVRSALLPLNTTARDMACAIAALYSTNCINVGVATSQQGGTMAMVLAIAQALVGGARAGLAPPILCSGRPVGEACG